MLKWLQVASGPRAAATLGVELFRLNIRKGFTHMSFKTGRGTELQLLNLKGKDYLPVAQRLVWFREEKPLWGIETSFLALEADFAIAKAEVKDEAGRVIASAHKREDAKHFPDFMEKAETGAIGRALAEVGYGTQFAPELDEEDRIVDSPQPARRPTLAASRAPAPAAAPAELSDPGSFVMSIGKNQGKRLDEIDIFQLNSWLEFMKKAENPSGRAQEAIDAVEQFLATRERPAAAR